jgi:fructokinase
MTEAPDEKPTLIGIGELLWDCFPQTRRPGGAPANVAFHAGQLGLRGLVLTRIGTDALGDELLRYLTERGLDTRGVTRDPQRPTGTVDVRFEQDGPAYTIHEDVAWDHIPFEPWWEPLLANAAAICFGTLAQRSQTSRDTIHRCIEIAADAWRIYDVNLRPPFFRPDWIERSLHLCRAVKLNHEELPQIARMLAIEAETALDQAAELRRRFAIELVCVTRAAEGCALLSDSESIDVPGRTVDVADSVGAGDAFTAALATGLVWGWPISAIGPFANAVGGLVTTRAGAMPDLRDELASLVTGHRPPA